MARTKTTRRTYTNKKLQANGNPKEAESARIEAPLQDVCLSQPQAEQSIAEKSSHVLPDPEPINSEGEGLQKSPILGCSTVSRLTSHSVDASAHAPVSPCLQEMSPVLGSSQRNVNSVTTSTPMRQPSDNRTVSATYVSPSSASERSSAWDSSMKENHQLQANFRPVTPDMSNIPDVDEIFSPKTQNEFRSTFMACFPNGPPPPPPVRPVRRPKKGDTPYIVGCTTRRRVPSPKCLSVFQGDDYGITDKTNCDEDEQCSPAKRGRRGPKGSGNLSKSRFNPMSDEIADRLKLHEKIDRLLGRTPKEEQVGYMTKPSTSRKFSPIPSTSFDSETIMKNDKHFSESLNCDDDNFDIDDDDDLPEIVWESSKFKQKKTNDNDSPLALVKKETTDFKIETDDTSDYDKSHTSVIVNDIDDDPKTINEDLNNNNDVICVENEFCEIDFDKYLPKEKLIFTDEEINAKPKTGPELVDIIELSDSSYMAPRATPTNLSSDVVCIDESNATANISANGNSINPSTSQKSADQVTSTVLRASNKMPSAETTPDLVIEVPDVLAPTVNTSSQASNRLPVWNEDVQFVSETRTNTPRPDRENISDVQIVGTSQPINTVRNAPGSSDLLDQLQNFFAFLSETTSRRARAPAKKRAKKQKPCHTAVVNNENAAPTVNQMPTPVTQPVSDATGSPPNGKRIGDCPICLDSLTRGSIASTNCGHVFCLECIKQSLLTSGKRCPTCRKQLKGAGYHQVFL